MDIKEIGYMWTGFVRPRLGTCDDHFGKW